MSTWAHVRAEEAGADTASTSAGVEGSLRSLTEALHAIGFRFFLDGKAGYDCDEGDILPRGPSGQICVIAANFVASLVPIVGDVLQPHDHLKSARVAMEESFQALSDALGEAGYLDRCCRSVYLTGRVSR